MKAKNSIKGLAALLIGINIAGCKDENTSSISNYSSYSDKNDVCYETIIPRIPKDLYHRYHIKGKEDLRLMINENPVYANDNADYRNSIINNECVKSLLKQYNLGPEKVEIDLFDENELSRIGIFSKDSLENRTLEQQASYYLERTRNTVYLVKNPRIAINSCSNLDDVRNKSYDFVGVLIDKNKKMVFGYGLKLEGV